MDTAKLRKEARDLGITPIERVGIESIDLEDYDGDTAENLIEELQDIITDWKEKHPKSKVMLGVTYMGGDDDNPALDLIGQVYVSDKKLKERIERKKKRDAEWDLEQEAKDKEEYERLKKKFGE